MRRSRECGVYLGIYTVENFVSLGIYALGNEAIAENRDFDPANDPEDSL